MKENEKDNDKKKDKIYYTIFSVVVMVALIIIAFALFGKDANKEDKEIAYTELITKIDENAVEKIEMTVGSTSIKVKLKNEEEEKNAIVPSTQAFIELVQEKRLEGNSIELNQKPISPFLKISGASLIDLPSATGTV